MPSAPRQTRRQRRAERGYPTAAATSSLVPVPVRGADVEELLKFLTPRLDGPVVPLRPVAEIDPHALEQIAVLTLAAQELLDEALAENTRDSYASHVRAWATWCRQQQVTALPADPHQVALHLSGYVMTSERDPEGRLRIARDDQGNPIPAVATASVELRLAAINKIHENARLPLPGDDPHVVDLIRGVRRLFHVRPRHAKAAIDQQALGVLVRHVTAPRRDDLRRWAAVLLAAYTALGPAALRRLEWGDLVLAEDHVELTTFDAAGEQTGVLQIPAARDTRFCLLATLRALKAGAPHRREVLVDARGRALSRQALHQLLATVTKAHGALGPGRQQRAALRTAYDAMITPGAGKGLRDAALLTGGWYAALRRDEMVSVRWTDLTRRPDGGWEVLIRASKTDPDGIGDRLYLPVASGNLPCPATAMDNWLAHLTTVLGADPRQKTPDAPVFCQVDRYGRVLLDGTGAPAPLTGGSVNTLIQDLTTAAGLAPRREQGQRHPMGGHSLRVGFVTEALRDGKLTVTQVQRVTRHKSVNTLIRYERELRGYVNSPVHRLVTLDELVA